MTAMGKTAFTPLMASPRKFKQYGAVGNLGERLYPEIATCVDDMAMVRSCWADGLTHVGSVCEMNTGSILMGRPCLGAWVLYGLGSVCDNLPGYVVLTDYQQEPPGGNRQWSTGFMPSTYQGTKFRGGKTPILNVDPLDGVSDRRQREKLDFIQQLNRNIWMGDAAMGF